MIVRRHLSRRRSLVAVAAVVAVVATGCSGSLVGPSPAATVGDTDITRAELDARISDYQELVEALGDAAEARRKEAVAAGQSTTTAEQLEAQVAERLAPYQGTEYTVGSEGVATQLSQMIGEQVVAEALSDLGVEVTDEQLDAARADLASSIEADGGKIDDLPSDIIDAFVAFDAGQAALREAAPQELRDAIEEAAATYEEQLRSAYEADPEAFARVCGRLLGAEDEAAAQAALARVEGGEAFADVAAEVSTIDPTAGSGVQCYDQATIVAIFGEPEPTAGDLLGPADNSGAWVVLEVDSLETAPFEEAREALAQQIPDQLSAAAEAALSDHLAEVIRSAAEDVTVDPRYGTWDAESLQVVPNTVEATTTTLPVDQLDPATVPAGS